MSEDRERRAYRRHKKRQKTNRLKEIAEHTVIGSIWFEWTLCEDGQMRQTGAYPKRSKHSHMQRFYKRYSNRIIRKSEMLYQNGGYRKAFDYWWTLY